ncbi:hypothetical protein H7H51_09050, partial [Mycolicibacterium farcinogenes]|nr:hypothetical protein [Mycolicibacterium farcinogenes]
MSTPATGAVLSALGLGVLPLTPRLSIAPGISATVAVSPVHVAQFGDAYLIARSAMDIAVRAGRT